MWWRGCDWHAALLKLVERCCRLRYVVQERVSSTTIVLKADGLRAFEQARALVLAREMLLARRRLLDGDIMQDPFVIDCCSPGLQ